MNNLIEAPRLSLKRKLALQLTIVCAVFAFLFIIEFFVRLYLQCAGYPTWYGRLPINRSFCSIFEQNIIAGEILRFVSAIALTQVVKVALVGLFCAFIFNRGVTRHISAMASYLKKVSTHEHLEALNLKEFSSFPSTELHDIETNLNSIVKKLRNLASESKGHRCGTDAELVTELERVSATCETVTSILHDISNGLSVLLQSPGHIERLVASDRGVDPSTKAGIGKVLETQERIVAMMSKLIASQQAVAASKGRLTAVSLSEVVSDAIEIEGMRFVRAGISIERDRLTDYSMHGSREIYMSILINLLKNAREAILTGDAKERVVSLSSWQEGDKVIFEIRDSGCGICPDKLAQIGTHGFSTKNSGQGLGLAGAKRMLTDMNGWLEIDSPGLGLGTSVKIGLPSV